MTQEDVLEDIRRIGCACSCYDDAGLCLRIMNAADWQLAQECGSPSICDCECHELWSEWCVYSEEMLRIS